MESKSRIQFEAWMQGYWTYPFSLDRDKNGFYICPHTMHYWGNWQASRAALVVELPEWFVIGNRPCMHMDDVEESIRAAGITVKGEGDE